jgi:DNA invertase Pin-like site-specific DNA recombinase
MEQYVKYLRKSRLDRDYAELSVEETLKRHEHILDDLASKRGYYIAKTYREVVSGDSIAARPEIRKLLDEVGAGLYAGVLVVDVERLARGNSADQAYISQIFQFTGTKIITPNKTYDPSNEFDEEYFEFGLFMSRREYKTIKRRLVRGRESSASEGKYLGSIAPYGYERVKLPDEKGYTLAPHPEEAKVVQTIFDMYVHNNGTKIIANYLNDNHIPTRHGDLWTYSTISNIVTNPVYMGKIRRGWCQSVKALENGVITKKIKHLKNMNDYTVYEGRHPPLIGEDVFHLAQSARITKAPSPKVKDDFVLQNAFAGLIYCSVCGKRIGRTTNRSVPRLRCVNGRNCHNVSADYYEVEEKAITALRDWLAGYKVKIDTTGFADEIEQCVSQLQKLEQEAEKLNAQLDNTYDLVEQGVYTLAVFQSRRDKLTSELSDLQARQDELSFTLTALQEKTDTHSNLIPQTETLLASYDDMTVAERNKLLKTILQRIEYRKEADGKITIDLFPRLPKI